MTAAATKIRKAASLDELLDLLSGPLGREVSANEWKRLPTFGGHEPSSTSGVWSWDPSRMLVGTCPSDLQIVRRPREISILIRMRHDEHEAIKRAAKRAGLPVGTWLRDLGMREANR